MRADTESGAVTRLRPELTRLLALGWAGGLALVFLVRFGAWLLPAQLAQLIAATLPQLACGPHFGKFILSRAWDFACVGAILATAFALGAIVVDRLVVEKNLLTALLALACGFWILAVLALAVGTLAVRDVPLIFCGALAWLLPAPRKFLRRTAGWVERLDGWSRLLIVCAIVAAGLNLAGAVAPPFEYDELEYHLGALAEYIRAGRIVFLPHNFYSNLPQATEMLYLLATVTSSDVAAKLLHWTFGVVSGLAIYAVASRLWSRNVAVAAAALFYCLPFVQDLSQTARVDLATTLFAALAFGALLSGRDQAMLRCSALMAGAAAATKWTAIPVVVLPALLSVIVTRKSFVPAAGYALLATVGCVPWVIKNWVFAGNPVYPLLYGALPSPHWSAAQAALFADKHSPTFGLDGLANVGGYLWRYSFVESRVVPLLLMVAPLILLLRRVDDSARKAGWLFVTAYAGWFLLTFRPWRFLFPAFPLAAMVGAYALRVLETERAQRWIVRGAVGVVLVATMAALALNALVDVGNPERIPPRVSFLSFALGRVSRDEFVAQIGDGVLEPIIWMNQYLPDGAKVLYVGEARAYYARHAAVWSTAFDQHPLTAMSREAADAGQLSRVMRAAGITHVYINFPELARLSKNYEYLQDANWSVVRTMLQSHATEIYRSKRGAVYELTR